MRVNQYSAKSVPVPWVSERVAPRWELKAAVEKLRAAVAKEVVSAAADKVTLPLPQTHDDVAKFDREWGFMIQYKTYDGAREV